MLNKRSLPLVLVFACAYVWGLDDDEWFGLNEQQYSLGLHYAFDNDDESQWSASITLPGPRYSEISLAYADISSGCEGEEQKLTHYALAWASDVYATWQFDVGYAYTGKPRAIELNHYQLGLKYMKGVWRGGLNVYAGYLQGYSRETLSQRFAQIPSSARVDRNGGGIELAYFGDYALVNFHIDSFSYSRDLSNVLHSRMFLLSFDGSVLSQILQLKNWSSGLQFSTDYSGVSFLVGLEHYEQHVDTQTDWLYMMGASKVVSENIVLSFDVYHFKNDETNQADVSLTVNW